MINHCNCSRSINSFSYLLIFEEETFHRYLSLLPFFPSSFISVIFLPVFVELLILKLNWILLQLLENCLFLVEKVFILLPAIGCLLLLWLQFLLPHAFESFDTSSTKTFAVFLSCQWPTPAPTHTNT